MVGFRPPIAPLFVPADKPDRYIKAATSGADAVIIDLEDAVEANKKSIARQALTGHSNGLPVPVIVRINGAGTAYYDADVDVVSTLEIAAVMLPKAASPADIARLSSRLESLPIIPLIETAYGLASLPELVRAPNVCMLAFGSIDYALDLGCSEDRLSLLHARSEVVFRSRLGGLFAPLDGVNRAIAEPQGLLEDCRSGVSLGFGGKLAIHPKQIPPIRQSFLPSADDVTWANQIIAVSKGGAAQLEGEMVDKPVVERAQRILARAQPLA